jgi:hypothetical protein
MLSRALSAAIKDGWLILPDIGVPGLASASGSVLRYELSANGDAVAEAVRRVTSERLPIGDVALREQVEPKNRTRVRR